MDHVHHEQRYVGRIVHGCRLDIHEVLQAPLWLGVSDIELDLEAQAVIIDQLRVTQIQIAAKEHDMGAFVGREVRFHDDDDMKRLSKLCAHHLGLVDVGLDVVFHATLFQVATWDVGIVNLFAILATRASASIRSLVREREGSIMAQLGNHM